MPDFFKISFEFGRVFWIFSSETEEISMDGKVLVLDQEKCTGCRQCELVCSIFHTGASNPSRSRIKVVKWEHVGFYLPTTCQNCEKPFCVEVCPTKACHTEVEHQRVVIDKNKCIGCKTCIIACPFGAPLFDTVERVTIKCDFCDGNPQCASFCEIKAIRYVEADRINVAKKRDISFKFSEAMRQTLGGGH
jgi:Fe-S-cluster-containing dehydrogenase component